MTREEADGILAPHRPPGGRSGGANDPRRHNPTTLAERRHQIEFLFRTLDREAHVQTREPEVLPSHLHNMIFLAEGEDGPAGPLLERARYALVERPWLRLTNRPATQRSAYRPWP